MLWGGAVLETYFFPEASLGRRVFSRRGGTVPKETGQVARPASTGGAA